MKKIVRLETWQPKLNQGQFLEKGQLTLTNRHNIFDGDLGRNTRTGHAIVLVAMTSSMSITDRAAGNEIRILTPNLRYSFVWQWIIENNSNGI